MRRSQPRIYRGQIKYTLICIGLLLVFLIAAIIFQKERATHHIPVLAPHGTPPELPH